MLKLLKYLKKIDLLYLVIIIGFVVTQVWLELKIPDYTAKLSQLISIETMVPGSLEMKDIWYNGGMMLLLTLGSAMMMVLTSFLTTRVAADWAHSLRHELMAKVTTFSNVEMNKFSTPSLITRTTNDVVQVQNFIAIGFQLMVKAPITAVWAIIKISNTSIEWTTATALFVLAILIVVIILILLATPKFQLIQKLTDDLNGVTRENISGVRVVRAFNAEDYQNQKFEKVNRQVTDTNIFTSRTLGVLQPFIMFCMSMLTVAIYVIGARLINEASFLEKAVVFGNMTAYTQLAIQVVMSFMMLVMIYIILPRTQVASKRIYAVLSTIPSIQDGPVKEGDVKGMVEFKNVSFSYVDDVNRLALSNLSFSVNPGEVVAIIGSTGAGKTTLVNLITRFYDPTEGEVLVNGVNVKDYEIESLNRHIAIATQKAVLFTGDVKKNITYGSDQFDEARFKQAINVAQAHFIDELDDKENAYVAQGGTNFSGGQKQRLAIARTLYKDADILIFDDSFSALDYKTDMLVRKGIKETYHGKTVFIIAQRIGTIKQADKIIVLNEGKIVGLGRHHELLKTCEVYKDIALSQLSEAELQVKEAN